MPGDDPSTQRRKLKAGLQKARAAAEMTQREAAERLAWSESKLIRIENGEVGLSVTDLRAMLQLYGVTDERAVASLSEAARGSRGSSWWSRYRDVVSPKFALYLGQEASASSIRVFHPFLIPGLLHTEEYAFELLRVHSSAEKARRIVQMRSERQDKLFSRPDSPETIFVVGEEALHRWMGGPAVMRRQLQYLLDISERQSVSVEVIPFWAGSHPGLLGGFILLGFRDSADSLLFVEGLSGELVSRDDQEKVSQFTGYLDDILGQATPAGQARALIGRLIENFRQADGGSSGGAARLARQSRAAIGMARILTGAREDRWGSLSDGPRNRPSPPPQARTRSLASSPGLSATGAARYASSPSSAACYSPSSPVSQPGSAVSCSLHKESTGSGHAGFCRPGSSAARPC
jgi:transcriptional regulator with XRE-family HTH domain